MLIEQLINLEKVWTDNLKFRTDLWDQVVVSNPVDDCLQMLICLLQILVAIDSESHLT